ncbi:hypothetical protein [Vagococcus sp.]|uniref:hypothetical protein n=1 Tax=Vagococcus sp. TaxID=1933889 RepID=UPI003F9DCEA1
MSNDRLIDLYPKVSAKRVLDAIGGKRKTITLTGQRIDITYQPSNLGQGEVPFFICPVCDKPRREMYLKSCEWLCYKCHDFTYHSQQRTRNSYWYWVRRAEKEARKIDLDFRIKGFNDFMNHRWLFPYKAKYMQQRKYDNIRFWYGIYMFRAGEELYNLMAPARAFIQSVKKEYPNYSKTNRMT